MGIKMKIKLSGRVFVVLLIMALLFSAFPALADDSNDTAGDLPEVLQFESNDEPVEEIYQVTLITGDIVTVVAGADGERHFSVSPAEPERLGQHFLTIEQDGDTYIIPDGVNLEKLDMELFNVDYLVDEQYYRQSSLPLLVGYLPGLSGPEVQSLEGKVKALGPDTELYSEVAAISTRLGYNDIPASYESLINQPEVQKIWLDKKVHVQLSDSVPLIGAPAWWDSGYNGAGVEIAILDTGIDSTHPALDDLDDDPGTTDPKVLVNVNFSDDTNFEDLYGHGTHVAGIAAGTQIDLGSNWNQVIPKISPHARHEPELIYDSDMDKIVMFGGEYGATTIYFNDTWEYDDTSNNWTEIATVSSPPARTGFGMVFDSSRNKVILFGGYDGSNLLGDTWEYDGTSNTWTEVIPASSPPARIGHAMAFDSSRNKVILYGGTGVATYGDTWEYDGTSNTWTEVTPASSPPARTGHAMAFDSSRDKVVMFGGNTGILPDSTWEYDSTSNTWTEVTPALSPSGRIWHDMVFDDSRDRVVLFGGYDASANPFLSDTWEYDGTTQNWTELTPASCPSARSGHAMAFDSSRNKIVMFGGYYGGALDDTWEYNADNIIGGVAPGACLWNVKVLNQSGSGYESWIINGINFASLGPDGIAGTGDEADIINMSLGGSYNSDGSDPLSQAVEWAVEQGVVVVIAAGNSGSSPYTITTPGVAENAITVGATDKADALASFSSRGPTIDARVKPDIVAPGVNINSSIPGGVYEPHSGTSMATPHVAGAAALLLESTSGMAPHGLSLPRFIKDALMSSAEDLGYTVYEQGSGRLDMETCWGSETVIETPIPPEELEWSVESIPSEIFEVLEPQSDILDFAVAGDGTTLYAVGTQGADTAKLYKSTNGGVGWSDISSYLAGQITSTTYVAVAPDNPDIVAVADAAPNNGLGAAISDDGGDTWSSMGVIQNSTGTSQPTAILGLEISPLVTGNFRYIAVYGRDDAGTASDAGAALYYYNYGAGTSVWREATYDFVNSPTGNTTIDNFVAMAFSPGFFADYMAVALSEQIGGGGDNGYLRLHILSFNSRWWDTGVASGYPVVLLSATAASTAFSVNAADIALHPDYDGGDEALRICFPGASVSVGGYESGGMWCCRDSAPAKALLGGDTSMGIGINSVTFDGTNMAGGAYMSNNVYRCADPMAASPTFLPANPYKKIGVDQVCGVPDNCPDKVQITFNGDKLYGAKMGTASAFSVSTDYGASFNDISLIDTTILTIEDVAVSADGSRVYLVTTDGPHASVWRYESSSWQRVLSLIDLEYYDNGMIRIAPDNPDAVYVTARGSHDIYFSEEGGHTSWFKRTYPAHIQDLAVESDETVYIADYNSSMVRKSTSSGFNWGPAVDTGIVDGDLYMITSLGEDELIVGSDLGYVSYSTDGNSSWTAFTEQIDGGLWVQVTASGLNNGDYIYAGTSTSSDNIYRWQIGTSSNWTDIIDGTLDGIVTGIGLSEGALFVLVNDPVGGRCWWTSDPTAPSPVWNTITRVDMRFDQMKQSLRTSEGRLWAIDNDHSELYSCTLTEISHEIHEIMATPASLSLGEFGSADTNASGMYTFLTGIDAHDITLTAELINIFTGVDYSGSVTLSPDFFTIPAGGEVDVSLDIDLTGLPASVYSGKVTAVIDGDSQRTVNAIFGFTKKYNVTVHKIDINGDPAQKHPVWIITESPSLDVDIAGYTDESGNLTFSVTTDNFHVISPGTYEADHVSIWTIAENVTVSGDTVVNLDERDTRVIDFDPDKPGQIPAHKEVELTYWSDYKYGWWGDSWWYPSSFITRISSASRFTAGFNYQYYPEADFLPDEPELVNTGEWHNLVFPMVALNDNPALQTRLLAVMSPSINSIADLDKGRIGVCSEAEIDWLQTALAVYGINCDIYKVYLNDYYLFLNYEIFDAVLVPFHPCPCLESYISDGTVRLLPWSSEAVNAVTDAYPQEVIATQLPPDTYQGQTESLPGYAPKNQSPVADYGKLVQRRASYNTAMADDRAYWRQRAYDDIGSSWSGHTYLMDAPQERWEWLSPDPVRYYVDYYKTEPYKEWYFDSPSITYSPGEHSWGIGGHPMTSGISMGIWRAPQPAEPVPPPAPTPAPSVPMAEEEYYLNLWGCLYEDSYNNSFNGNPEPQPAPTPEPVPIPPPATSPLMEPIVSTPTQMTEEINYTDIWSHTYEDTLNSTTTYNDEEEYPGHLTVHQDGAIVLDEDINYYLDYYILFEGTANFTAEIWGKTPLALSTESYTRLDFVADPASYKDSAPPRLLCQVPGIDLYGVVPDGEVSVKVYATDDYNLIENVGLQYSLDDGDNWIDAGLPVFADGAYIFNLGELQGTFVSLAASAEDEFGNSIYQETHRAFYVGGYGVTVRVNAPDVVPEDFDFTTTIDINYVEDLNAGQYDIWFDPAVLILDDVTDGLINTTNISASYNQIEPGHLRVVNSMGLDKVTGSGYLAELHFHSIGALGTSSDIDITDGTLSDFDMNSIPAKWIGDHVEVSTIPGDANGDNVVNIFDMTKVARIILELDDPTPGADANQDGSINVFDMTKIARIILELD